MNEGPRRAVVSWLSVGCLLIALMVTIGGVTRLTGSGLSITEWDVLMGTFPPLNAQAWQELWQKYQATPQFQLVNGQFTLDQFKTIFWWEYAHRFVARLLGVVFLVPFLWFLVRGSLDRPLRNRMLLIFALGALQGLLGWLMVASGLVDRPAVSHYRLAAHLLTALLTFGVTLWTALEADGRGGRLGGRLSWPLVGFTALLALQITYGAFVAGLKAGGIYNTFPLMGRSFVPPGLGSLSPWVWNLVANPVTVQFIHRLLGMTLLVWGLFIWRPFPGTIHSGAARLFGLALLLQFTLGVLTVLRWPGNPVFWGAVHQAGAVLLLAVTVNLLYRVRRL